MTDIQEVREELEYALEQPGRGPEYVPAVAAFERIEARLAAAEAALRRHHVNVWASCPVCPSTVGVQRDR